MNGKVCLVARASATVAFACVLLLGAAVVSNAQAAGLRTGCQPGRRAIAYRAGQGAVRRPPAGGPIPCLEVVSGRAGESANVALLRSGRILYAPLVENHYPAPLDDRGPAVVAASDDGGRSWRALIPGDTNHILDVPPWMSVDPQTQRIWFATVLPDLCGAEISWSNDAGASWTTNPLVGCPAMGSERDLEGPAPPGGAQPAGYPHVVYYCANLSDLSPSNLWCYRSLNGGGTFTFTGGFPDPPPKPGCGTEHPARPGAVGTDGDLYFPVYQCGELSVAISRNEGVSWQWVHVARSAVQDLYTTSMAVDSAGNLYLAWIQAVPGAPTQPAGAGPNPATDALAAHALWWAAPLNDPATPLIDTRYSTTFGDRLFFTTDTFAPGGEPYAAFHCAKTARCPNQRIGVVGWLARAQAPMRPHPHRRPKPRRPPNHRKPKFTG